MENFTSFDLNEACDYFDFNDTEQWAKIEPFVVFDCDNVQVEMERADFYDISSDEYEAFQAGVEHALAKVNLALESAGVDLRIASSDLGNNMGYILIKEGDTPKTWAKRVFKKPRRVVDSWA